jgi:hypothetical protein
VLACTVADAFIQLPDADIVKRIDRLEFKVRKQGSRVMHEPLELEVSRLEDYLSHVTTIVCTPLDLPLTHVFAADLPGLPPEPAAGPASACARPGQAGKVSGRHCRLVSAALSCASP